MTIRPRDARGARRRGAAKPAVLPALSLVLTFFLSAPGLQGRAQDRPEPAKAETAVAPGAAPRVFVDCSLSGRGAWRACDIDYIRTEVRFMNFVRDRKDADIHLLITSQDSAGGLEFTVAFIGRNGYAGIDDTLRFYASRVDAEDTIREGLVRVIKAGLMRYVARSPLLSQVTISFPEKLNSERVKDSWDHWIFSLYGGGFLNGEESSRRSDVSGRAYARRVTPEMKAHVELEGASRSSLFRYTEDGQDVSYESLYRSYQFDGLLVFSLGEHWSAGAYAGLDSDTYRNNKLSLKFAPALEFNVFPYSASTRKQFRLLYRLRFSRNSYFEETIYDRLAESLLSQSLSVDLVIKQPWGSAQTSLEASHYFQENFKHNRLSLWGSLDLKIFKGLSLDLGGSYAIIHDQLSLQKGDLSPEEVLLQRKQMATNYRYRFSIGLSYTFGSIFSNVVNPRFGSG
ncbi:MAG: hypothetical protein FJY83_09480 [Candidatus Aminicenantes bacterium]|nr:hypothetical protein [Candidatus Aminicenantes bacterium]